MAYSVDLTSVQDVEQEIDTLISIAGDNPSDEIVTLVTNLVRVANALGTTRKW